MAKRRRQKNQGERAVQARSVPMSPSDLPISPPSLPSQPDGNGMPMPPMPVPFHERNLFWGAIGVLGLSASIVITVIAAMLHDVRWLLWVAGLVGMVAIFCFKRVFQWSPWFLAFGFVTITSMMLGVNILVKQQVSAVPPVIDRPTVTAQAKPVLEDIDDFIASKDENGLREQFDFPDMLKYNILYARRNLFPKLVSLHQSEDIDRYFTGGQARIDTRYAKVSNVNNRADVEWIPGRIGVISTSAKYNTSRHHLAELYSSASTPAPVANALKDLDDVVEKNSTWMIESLNDSLSTDPRYISENDTAGSRFYGSASGAYWTKFTPLSSKGDTVRISLRVYLSAR